jgi:hypothetical protein
MLSPIQVFCNRTAAHLYRPLHSTLIGQFLDVLHEVINISTCSLARNRSLCTQASVLGAAGFAYSNTHRRGQMRRDVLIARTIEEGRHSGLEACGVERGGNVSCIGCISYHPGFLSAPAFRSMQDKRGDGGSGRSESLFTTGTSRQRRQVKRCWAEMVLESCMINLI